MIHLTRIALVTLATGLWAAATPAQDLKIGYVNSERVLREAAPAKAAQSKLESEFGKREKDLNDQGARLKAAAEKLDKDAPALNSRRISASAATRSWPRWSSAQTG